ncbi:MAG: ROK family protein [Candidatus Omnitrophica bacterium]|nr:ROK family protein [Candidatus Omnitrophota bacterium]
MSYIIGIDIGGTKISVVLGDERGKIYDKKIITPRLREEARQSITELKNTITLVLHQNKVSISNLLGIGFGVPGQTDPKRGIITSSPNLPGWEGLPLRSSIQSRFKRPVFWDNDANAAAIGEKIFGGGKGFRDFVYITVSTGIGSGIVCNGEIVRGASGNTGEMGHMTIIPGGNKCNCGKRGCLEAYASGTAIAKRARAMIKMGKPTSLTKIYDPSKITCETVSVAAEKGDRLSLDIFQNAGHFLGIGIANIINILNPERIFIGGSVLKGPACFWKSMLEAAKKEAWPIPFKACRIEKTKLGDKVGDLGTIALVVDSLR